MTRSRAIRDRVPRGQLAARPVDPWLLGDADRDRFVAVLREHYAAGRLSLDELRRRVGIVLAKIDRLPAEQAAEDLGRASVNVSTTVPGDNPLDTQDRGVHPLIRFSPPYYNTEDEIDRAAELVAGPLTATAAVELEPGQPQAPITTAIRQKSPSAERRRPGPLPDRAQNHPVMAQLTQPALLSSGPPYRGGLERAPTGQARDRG